MVDRLISDSLRRIEDQMIAQEKAIEGGITALLRQRSEIEASGKRLANLSSLCSILDSLLARLREVVSEHPRSS